MTQQSPTPASFDIACDQFDAQLMAYLERDLDVSARDWMQQHLAVCARCHALLADLEGVVQNAAMLPALTPSQDLWAGIAARLETAVVPLHRAVEFADTIDRAEPANVRVAFTPDRRHVSLRRFAIAATLLMAVSSAVTWRVARVSPSATPLAVVSVDSAEGMSLIPVVRADVTYEQEIAALRAVVNERFAELDTATVAVLRRNLAIIDQAIADSRAALEQDPGSRMLSSTLDRALETKLSLMRRVALL